MEGRIHSFESLGAVDGPGLRYVIFMQGCSFHCKNCFNPETWDFESGKEFTDATIDRILELSDNDNIEGLSILGGEPMHPQNIENTTKLAKAFLTGTPRCRQRPLRCAAPAPGRLKRRQWFESV